MSAVRLGTSGAQVGQAVGYRLSLTTFAYALTHTTFPPFASLRYARFAHSVHYCPYHYHRLIFPFPFVHHQPHDWNGGER